MKRLARAQNQIGMEPVWMYRQEPIGRISTIEGEVLIPLFQAVIVSAAWALLAGLGVGLLVYWTGLTWWAVPLVVVGVAFGGFAFQVTRFIQERRELLWKREETENRDLNGDGVVGKPDPVTLTVEVVTQHNGGRQIKIVDLGISPEKATALARGLLSGRPFSEADWTGSGKPFSRNEFKTLRSTLLERGLVCWRNPEAPAQGIELSRIGRAIFERLAQGA